MKTTPWPDAFFGHMLLMLMELSSTSSIRAISSNERKTTMRLPRDAGAAAAAADDEDEEALPEEEENRPILPYSSFFILSSTNP